jgi:hypothetical protein
MADNVAITEGSGKTVLADEVTHATLGTGVAQAIKTMDGRIGGSMMATVLDAEEAPTDQMPALLVAVSPLGQPELGPQLSSASHSMAPATDAIFPTGGDLAHGTADSTTKPVKIGIKAVAGVSAETPVDANDRTNALGGTDGVQYVRPHCGLEDIVSGVASNTDGTSTEVIATAGSGVKQYLTSVTIANMHASTFAYVELKSGTTVMYRLPVPPGGVTQNFPVPLKPNAANEAWNFDPSAAVTTLYCSMVGFKSKV